MDHELTFANVDMLCIPYELLPVVATGLENQAVDGDVTEAGRQWLYEQATRLRADYDEETRYRNHVANILKSHEKI